MSRSPALPISVALFLLGVLAVVVVFALYAAGGHDLPLWLNLATLLAPIGLISGVVTAVARTRRSSSR